MVKVVILIIVISATCVASIKYDKKCIQGRSHGMKSADCYNLDYTEIPQTLRDDIQILDMSKNRLRTLKNDSFIRYTSLKLLYLQDNLIMHMDRNTFAPLSKLEVLDLSLNGIQTLPPVIFHLPSLKKLYLGQNMNINIAEIIDAAQPIIAPLVHLDLSFNDMTLLPDLGVIPEIFSYNISGNSLMNMTPKDFAGLCKLEYLFNNNFTADFEDPCNCVRLTNWFKERNVKTSSKINCNAEPHDCENLYLAKIDNETFGHCKSIQQSLTITRGFINYGLPILAVILLIALGVLYWYCKKRNRKQSNDFNPKHIRTEEPLVS